MKCIPERLRQRLSCCLREVEGGQGPKEGTHAKDEEWQDWRELGEVDNCGRKEDGNSSNNLTQGNLRKKSVHN